MTENSTTDTTAPEGGPTRYGLPFTEARGQLVLHARPDELLDAVDTLIGAGHTMCVDVCGVDYRNHRRSDLPPGVEAQRFEVVYGFVAHATSERVRIRVQVPADAPEVPTLFDRFPGTEAMEREAYDMYGIVFADHPDPTRVLMPEDWHGHPLRKDYDVGAIPVQFKGAPS